MDAKELQTQLDGLKDNLKQAFSVEMKASIKKDIEEVEAKMAAVATKNDAALEEINGKLAKVISAQDDQLKTQNDAKTAAAGKEVKSFEQLLGESMEENTDLLAKFARKELKSASFQLKAVGDMGFSGNFGSASQSVSTVRPGIIESQKRKVHIRDLVPQGTMDGSTFYYVAENGTGEGNPATVAENNFKEQMDLDLIERSANAEYIAGWLRISKKMLADVKGMTSFLQSRLREKLLRAEDNQLLNGNGSTPNIGGIIGANHFVAYNGGAAADVEELVLAISQLEDGPERDANGILIRPRNYYRMALNKASGSGEYDLPGIVTINNGQMYVAGVPVYASTAMQSDKFLVGDWRMGAQLLTREPAVVEFFYEDGTNVRENKVTVRVEERVAFPIFGDDYFVYGDFGNS
jgi:HK97 family phage major capsid protein